MKYHICFLSVANRFQRGIQVLLPLMILRRNCKILTPEYRIWGTPFPAFLNRNVVHKRQKLIWDISLWIFLLHHSLPTLESIQCLGSVQLVGTYRNPEIKLYSKQFKVHNVMPWKRSPVINRILASHLWKLVSFPRRKHTTNSQEVNGNIGTLSRYLIIFFCICRSAP